MNRIILETLKCKFENENLTNSEEIKMKSTRLVLLSLFTVIALFLAACGGAATEAGTEETASQPTQAAPTEASSDPVPASGGDLVLDPANATSDNARAAAGYLFEGLMAADGTGALAESYTVSEDGLDYIFNLRPGVAFHDGTLLTADVVVLNFNRWYDPNDANRGSGEFAAWAANFGGFKGELTDEGTPKSTYDGIEKVNDFTVLVHLNTEDPDFLKKMSDPAFSIVSPNAFAGGDGGSGPYKFASLSGSTATLEPFAGYWNPSAIPGSNMDVPLE
jgi:peptide/nickel transport system substrate-binding protein